MEGFWKLFTNRWTSLLIISGVFFIGVLGIVLLMYPPFQETAEIEIDHVNSVRRGSQMTMKAVALDGTAYVAEGAEGFRILNITDPSSPELVAHINITGYAHDVVVQGSYAYMAAGSDGLMVARIAGSDDPEIVGQVTFDGIVQAVCVYDHYVFLLGEDICLTVVDVENPEQPQIVTCLDSIEGSYSGCPYDLVVSEDMLLVCVGGFYVVDISEPESPCIIGNPEFPTRGNKVVAAEDVVCVAYRHAVTILDFEDADNPKKLAEIDTRNDLVIDVTMTEDNLLVMARSSGAIEIFNITNPNDRILVGECEIPVTTEDLSIVDDFVLVSAGERGLHIVDANDPRHPLQIGKYDTPSDNFRSLEVIDGKLVVSSLHEGLQLFSLAVPAEPEWIGTVEFDGRMEDFAVDESSSLAIAAAGSKGLQVAALNISSPSTKSVSLSNFTLDSQSLCVAALSPHVYLCDGDGMHVFDVSDPLTIQPLGSYGHIGIPTDIIIRDSVVYVLDTDVMVMDVSNNEEPTLLTSVDTGMYFSSCLFLLDPLLYAASPEGKLAVLDLTEPLRPVVVQTLHLDYPNSINGLHVTEELILMASSNGDLRVLKNHASLIFEDLGIVETAGIAHDVTMSGEYIYVADGEEGLQVFSWSGRFDNRIDVNCDFLSFLSAVFVVGLTMVHRTNSRKEQ